jgi:hypothetical protein
MTDIADLDVLLGRKDVAEALTARGFKTAETTLATLASRGGGPCFRKYGQRVVYRWGDALAWAEGRLTNPVTSTSELKAPRLGHERRPPSQRPKDEDVAVLQHDGKSSPAV